MVLSLPPQWSSNLLLLSKAAEWVLPHFTKSVEQNAVSGFRFSAKMTGFSLVKLFMPCYTTLLFLNYANAILYPFLQEFFSHQRGRHRARRTRDGGLFQSWKQVAKCRDFDPFFSVSQIVNFTQWGTGWKCLPFVVSFFCLPQADSDSVSHVSFIWHVSSFQEGSFTKPRIVLLRRSKKSTVLYAKCKDYI